ncbi:tRNA uridine-5-carboxymethylaminomethyl(34) synthesis GTPase MnmE [bacterium]|nr:tRNA uridine-5-carboxymethylaminomethyl(34) synthesis GTPase MnmE [bacterium]
MPAYTTSDTIVAPATVPGRSAIAMLRLSGPQAFDMLLEIMPGIEQVPQHRLNILHQIELKAPARSGLPVLCEQAMVCCHHAPRSYTGDNLVEIGMHGNPLLLERAIAALVHNGARLAEPGEFTFRAYVNGKLDLIQAEAVHELINAGSSSALALAQAALGGLSGARVNDWQEQLLNIVTRIELIHDYASDDLDASVQAEDVLTPAELAQSLQKLLNELESALEDSSRGGLIRHGLSLAIVGAPNVGKSTLFNALLGYDRALVHHAPGTTRDYLSESVEFGGLSFTLIDTAGQRNASDDVESAGVQLAQDWARSADMVIFVSSADENAVEPPQADNPIAGRQVLHVHTRCDLLDSLPEDDNDVFHVSGKTGQGIEQLRNHIVSSCGLAEDGELAAFNRRQAALIDSSAQHLRLALNALGNGMPMDAAAQDIHLSRECLLDVNHSSSRQDVINHIFSSFCVGK